MTSLFDEYLTTQPEKKREPHILYVTDIVKPCLRQAYLDIVDPKPHPIETLRIFEAGRVIERLWVDQVLPIMYTVLNTQLPARYHCDDFSIHGRVDALCQHFDGSLVVHEVKSAKSLAYTNEPKLGHVEQIQFYLNALNVEFGYIDYLDKSVLLSGGKVGSGSVDKHFQLQRDPKRFTEILRRAGELARLVKSGATPEAAPLDWYCDYCLHRKDCLGDILDE